VGEMGAVAAGRGKLSTMMRVWCCSVVGLVMMMCAYWPITTNADTTDSMIIPCYCVVGSRGQARAAHGYLSAILNSSSSSTDKFHRDYIKASDGVKENSVEGVNSPFESQFAVSPSRLLGVNYYSNGDSLATPSNNVNGRNVSILFLHPSILLSENKLFSMLQGSMRCLLRPEDDLVNPLTVQQRVASNKRQQREEKRSIIILTLGKFNNFDMIAEMTLQRAFDTLIEKAQQLLSFPAADSDVDVDERPTQKSVGELFDVRVFNIGNVDSTDAINGHSVTAFRSFLNTTTHAIKTSTATQILRNTHHRRTLETEVSYETEYKKAASVVDRMKAVVSASKVFSEASLSSSKVPVIQSTHGLLECREFMMNILLSVQNETQHRLPAVQQFATRRNYTRFVSKQLAAAVRQLRTNISLLEIKTGKKVDPLVVSHIEDKLKTTVLELFLPTFKKLVYLVRNEVISAFNRAVAPNDLPFTYHYLEDLKDYRDQALQVFQEELQRLVPTDIDQALKKSKHSSTMLSASVSSWDTNFEMTELRNNLNEFIDSKQVEYQLRGFFPRARMPTLFSIHALFSHPFGRGSRDYRQDPVLGPESGDVPIIVRDSAPAVTSTGSRATRRVAASPDLVSAWSAYQHIRSTDGQQPQSYMGKTFRNIQNRLETLLNVDRLSHDDEFAREMMMLPLSIKNPDVAITSAAGAGRKIPPKQDPAARKLFGPERY
jgi:hypothetical protein